MAGSSPVLKRGQKEDQGKGRDDHGKEKIGREKFTDYIACHVFFIGLEDHRRHNEREEKNAANPEGEDQCVQMKE
jgi:hypothetical protein